MHTQQYPDHLCHSTVDRGRFSSAINVFVFRPRKQDIWNLHTWNRGNNMYTSCLQKIFPVPAFCVRCPEITKYSGLYISVMKPDKTTAFVTDKSLVGRLLRHVVVFLRLFAVLKCRPRLLFFVWEKSVCMGAHWSCCLCSSKLRHKTEMSHIVFKHISDGLSGYTISFYVSCLVKEL